MRYVGKLFGQIGRTRGYFDTGKTSEDWDALEARAERAEAEVERLNALGSWAHTCLHHNDKQRTECPVCLVTTLTAEGDQLRAALAAECDQLRAEAERLRAGIGECLRQNGHLADGDNCTLIGLKRCLRDPTAARESNGGAA